MNRIFTLGAAVLLVIAGLLQSCRNNDFVYYVPAKTPNLVTGIHKLKELQGTDRVDIIWVIDNSASMSEHQKSVIQSANDFMVNFVQSSGLKWTLSLLSTDDANSPYLGFNKARLDYTTVDPVPIFQAAVEKLGLSGSGQEELFDPVVQAITNNPGYLNPRSMLAVIIVSDAPEQSDRMSNPQDFLNFLAQIKGGDLTKSIVYGALGPQDWGCPQSDNYWVYGTSAYKTVIEATHGKTFKLCTASFGRDLAEMGKDLVTRVVRTQIPLRQRPKPGTIQVSYLGKTIPAETRESPGYWLYDFDLNAVTFTNLSFATDENAAVDVSFEVDDGRDVQ